MNIPVIKVGIMADKEIFFTLQGEYLIDQLSVVITGAIKVIKVDSGFYVESGDQHWHCCDNVALIPLQPDTANFKLHDVVIGVNFHWERKEDQTFKGALLFIEDGDKLHAINRVSIEDYLLSVISSEMSATSSLEFLKAHAVISRSWLLAQVQKNKSLLKMDQKYQTAFQSEDELIRWYDREDHLNFDVCADDHCQRYQGITRASTQLIEEAVKETCGEVLVYNGLICDARFSKCCGGVTELFENVWEPVNHPYLRKVVDTSATPGNSIPDLTSEPNAVNWITDKPTVYCNTSDKKVLKQVLNDYDLETNDFFRWEVVYTQNELNELLKIRTGIDFGGIIDLIPMERGVSGRIIRLKIAGSLRTMTIGKELEIRKALSKTHLYSSAFIVRKHEDNGEEKFSLQGAGWGHGVGLCQIGAAVMGDEGFMYSQILFHYFPGAGLNRMY